MDKTVSDMGALMSASVYDQAPHGIVLTDLSLTVSGWNSWLEQHAGAPAAEVVGQPLLAFFPDLVRRGLDDAYRRALAGTTITLTHEEIGCLLPMPAPPNTAGYQDMQQDSRIAPLIEQGHVVGTVTVVADVTEHAALAATLADQRARDQALGVVTRALNEVGLRPDAMLATVARLAGEMVGDLAILWLVSPDGRWLEPAALYHADADFLTTAREVATSEPHPVDAGVNGQVVQTGTAQRVTADSPEALARQILPPHANHLIQALPFSLLAVPVRSRDQTIGSLSLSRQTTARPYTATDQTFIQDLADRAALAIEHARLYRAEQASTHQLQRLQAITSAFAHVMTAPQVASVVMEFGAPMLDAAGGLVLAVTADGAALTLLRSIGYRDEVLPAWQHVPIADLTPLSDAARLGESIFLESSAAWVARFPTVEPVRQPTPYQAFAILPLHGERAVIGVLAFSFAQPRSFGADARALLEAVAGQCAQALERARLYDAAQAARAEAERLAERADRVRTVTTALAAATTSAQVAALLLTHAAAAVDAQHGDIYQVDDGDLLPLAIYSAPGAMLAAETLDDAGPIVQVARTGQPFWREMTDREAPGRFQAGALAAVPLLTDGRCLGVLALAFAPTHSFPPAERAFIETMAGQAAQALVRTQIEAAVRASEERFRTLAGAVPSIVWAAAPDGRITYANDRWYAYCGLTPEENAVRWPEMALHPDDRERCATMWTRALRDGTDYEIEVRNRRHDGEYRWFLTRAVPTHDAAGQVAGWFGATTDIHDRKQAEAERERLLVELQAGEARYRGLFDGVADAIVVISEDGRYTEANRAAAALTGYSQDALRQMGIGDLSGDPAAVRAGWAALKAAGDWHGETDVRHRDGHDIPVETWVTSTPLPTGRTFISAMRDIRARRTLERQQQEFLAMISHDLKTPLTGISGMAQLMHRRGAYSERGVGVIINQAQHMQRLIDDLLDLARQEASQLDLRRVEFDLVVLVKTVAAATLAPSSAHRLHLTLPDQPVVGMWDHDRMTQLLHNLLSNAIKYSPDGGSIWVTLARDGHDIRLSVRDEGIGIAPAELPRLFDRYYRVRRARGDAIGGLGLGLAIAQAIVEAHGGRIAVESVEGAGSTFTVTLPVAGNR
ncbi:MAG: PAS domain S-box protein [Chloroflexi bacterium]|nr:PAS domain S-box protein [Chloroflexota bacterium]